MVRVVCMVCNANCSARLRVCCRDWVLSWVVRVSISLTVIPAARLSAMLCVMAVVWALSLESVLAIRLAVV